MKRIGDETLIKEIVTAVRQGFAFDLSWEEQSPQWLPVKQADIIGYKGEYLYIEIELFKKYKCELLRVFFGSGKVYLIGLNSVCELNCEDAELIEESFYSDSFYVSQSMKRVMYFFHEGTVTFAGKHFLHKIKKVLANP